MHWEEDGQQGGLQFGGGKSIIIPLQNALCSADKACAYVERQPSPTPEIGITVCLTSKLLSGTRSPPGKATQKRGEAPGYRSQALALLRVPCVSPKTVPIRSSSL